MRKCPDSLRCPSFEINDLGPARIFWCPDSFAVAPWFAGRLIVRAGHAGPHRESRKCPDSSRCPSFEINDLGPARIFWCPDSFAVAPWFAGRLIVRAGHAGPHQESRKCPDSLRCPSFEINDLGPARIFWCPDSFAVAPWFAGRLMVHGPAACGADAGVSGAPAERAAQLL